MGPYLVFEKNRPNFWLSWSMEDDTVQTVFVADYHNGAWQERACNDTTETFYVYDVSVNIATDAVIFCLVFRQSKVYRIVPHVNQHQREAMTSVNQVQRLKCNEKGRFYHIDHSFKAYDSAIRHPRPQPGFLIHIDLFPKFNSRELLDQIKEKHSSVRLPKDLTDKQTPAVPTPSEQLLKALDLDYLIQRLSEPSSELLPCQPSEIRDNTLYLWPDKETYHYRRSLHGVLLSGEISREDNEPLVCALSEFHADVSEHVIHEALHQKKLLQTLTSECFDLSLNQQKLIVARLTLDNVWPDIDSVKDESQLEELFFSFIDVNKVNELPAALKEIGDGFHQFMDPKRLVSIAQRKQFYDANDIGHHAGRRATLTSVHQFIYHLIFMAMRELDIDLSLTCIPECKALNPESPIGVALESALKQESIMALSAEESLVYWMLSDFHLNYSYTELESAVNTIRLLIEQNPQVELLLRLLSFECRQQLIDAGADPSTDLTGDIGSRVEFNIRRLADEIARRYKLLSAIHAWNEEGLLNTCQTTQEFVFCLGKQTSDEKIKQLMVQHKFLIKAKLGNQFHKYFYVFSQLAEPRRTFLVETFFADVFNQKINSAQKLADFLKNSSCYSPEFIAAVVGTVIVDGVAVQNDYDYEIVVDELLNQPNLVPVVFPSLAKIHRDILVGSGELHSFLHRLNDRASTWWSMLDGEMQVDLLSSYQPFLLLRKFRPSIRGNILRLLGDKLLPLVVSGRTIAAFLESCSDLRRRCFINGFATFDMQFLPEHLQFFSSSVQSQLLHVCASKLQLASLDDLNAWLKSVVMVNQSIILIIAASKGLLSLGINSNEQLNKTLMHLDLSFQDLFLRLMAPHLIHSTPTLDGLRRTLCFLEPGCQTRVVQILQSHGFEHSALPWLNLSRLVIAHTHMPLRVKRA